MRSEIRALQKRLDITMLYVTHDQTEAMSMADKVILLNEGRIEQAGSPAELYERPSSVFVAQFIGTPPMNLLDVADGPDGVVVKGGTRVLTKASGSGGLRFGIRPEHVHLAEHGEPAAVEFSEYFGADTILSCRIAGQSLQVRVSGRPNLQSGADVRIRWDPEAMHFFDKATGLRRDDVLPMQSK